MSDDTPTQRFPSGDSGDTPTQRLDTGEVQEDLQEEKQKSKGLLVGLVAAGGLLLLAIVVIAFFLLNRGQGDPIMAGSDAPVASESAAPTPEASETPSETPTPTSEPEDPPADNPQPTGAAFSSFNPTKQVSCSTGGPGFTPDPPTIQISWATVRADSAWIVMGTSDAADSGFMQIPLNGNQSDFQYTISFPCFQADATFTITLVGTDGQHVSKSWTVTNVGDQA